MSAPPAAGRYAFLCTRRWLGLVAVLLAVAVACVFLGRWQWHRYEDRSASARQVEAVYDAPARPLAAALPSPTGPVTAAQEWQQVALTGRYLPDATVLLRNRPVGGNPAVHVVTPFLADADGGPVLVVVDRGWLPAEAAEADRAELPPAPAGEVTLTGRLRVAEEPFDRDPPPGQVYTLEPGQVLAGAAAVSPSADLDGAPVLDGHVVAAGGQPGTDGLGGYGRPSFNYGMNFSYALQWWFFAVAAVGALVVLARREAAEEAGGPAPRARGSAEAEEDALVDAQLDAGGGAGGSGQRPGTAGGTGDDGGRRPAAVDGEAGDARRRAAVDGAPPGPAPEDPPGRPDPPALPGQASVTSSR